MDIPGAVTGGTLQVHPDRLPLGVVLYFHSTLIRKGPRRDTPVEPGVIGDVGVGGTLSRVTFIRRNLIRLYSLGSRRTVTELTISN